VTCFFVDDGCAVDELDPGPLPKAGIVLSQSLSGLSRTCRQFAISYSAIRSRNVLIRWRNSTVTKNASVSNWCVQVTREPRSIFATACAILSQSPFVLRTTHFLFLAYHEQGVRKIEWRNHYRRRIPHGRAGAKVQTVGGGRSGTLAGPKAANLEDASARRRHPNLFMAGEYIWSNREQWLITFMFKRTL
jgi:hypothetical protein